MPKTLSQVAREAAELSAPDRLKLARLMLDSTESDVAPTDGVEEAWEEEIQRRLEELRSGKVQGIPLDEVKRRMEQGFTS